MKMLEKEWGETGISVALRETTGSNKSIPPSSKYC